MPATLRSVWRSLTRSGYSCNPPPGSLLIPADCKTSPPHPPAAAAAASPPRRSAPAGRTATRTPRQTPATPHDPRPAHAAAPPRGWRNRFLLPETPVAGRHRRFGRDRSRRLRARAAEGQGQVGAAQARPAGAGWNRPRASRARRHAAGSRQRGGADALAASRRPPLRAHHCRIPAPRRPADRRRGGWCLGSRG